MRPVAPRAQAIRARRGAIVEYPMIWVEPGKFESNDTIGVGFWPGSSDDVVPVVDMWTGAEAQRTFYGAGSLLRIETPRFEGDLGVSTARISLSSIHPLVAEALRGYDAQGARVQIWRRSIDPETRAHVAAERHFKGFVDDLDLPRPPPGGEAVATLSVVSTARMLTIPSAEVISDAAQKARAPGDTLSKHAAVAASWVVKWTDA